MNTFAYVGAYIAIGIITMLSINSSGRDTVFYTLALMFAVNAIVHMVFVYQSWSAINDGRSSITPTKALVFHFIPIFNILWASLNFMVFFGAYNSYIKHHKMAALKLNTTVPFIYVFYSLFVYSGIFYAPKFVGFFALFQFIIFLYLVFKTCNAINSLGDREEAGDLPGTLGIT